MIEDWLWYTVNTFKGKENGKTIMRALIIYTSYYRFMCMHWLKYVRLNRKDQLKNMHGTTLEVAMLADVSGAYSAISYVYLCDWAPLTWAFFSPFGWTWLWLVNTINEVIKGVFFEGWGLFLVCTVWEWNMGFCVVVYSVSVVFVVIAMNCDCLRSSCIFFSNCEPKSNGAAH